MHGAYDDCPSFEETYMKVGFGFDDESCMTLVNCRTQITKV